jgi:hypothetical protein
MKRLKAAVAAVTIAGATTAAILIPSSPAVAFSSGGLALDMVVQSPAHLIAKGAAVGLPVECTCSGAIEASLFVNLTERVAGGALATGSSGLDTLVCTGEIQHVILDVPASSGGGRAFAKGSAFASAEISGCRNFCGQQNDNETIKIQK